VPVAITIIDGRITHLTFAVDGSCSFRLNGGAVVCRAIAPLSLEICSKRGWPNHTVRVSGNLSREAKKIFLAIDSVALVD
jgi:hypothetical protein